MAIYVIDTGPLSHAAQASKLDVLEQIFANDECYYPPAVCEELRVHSESHSALEASWIHLREPSAKTESIAIKAKRYLGGKGKKNLGEAECIELAHELHGAIFLDDEDGAEVAYQRFGIDTISTTELLFDAIQEGKVSKNQAREFIDDLLSTNYRGINFGSGEAFLRAYGL